MCCARSSHVIVIDRYLHAPTRSLAYLVSMTKRAKSKVTIYEVARHAGVAISTVSRVLNDSPDVSDRTRKKVEQAIDGLMYRPNRTARSLAQQEFHSFAVALPSFTAPFQNELLKGIRAFLREGNQDLLICDLGSNNTQDALMSFLDRGAVRGLLLCGMPVDDDLAGELSALQAPTVLIGYAWPAFDSFIWDDVAGAESAVTHLLENGHSYVCMICSAIDSENQLSRIKGYRKALTKAGISFDPGRIVEGKPCYHAGFSEEDGYDAMQTILKDHPETTAVFASSDVQAIGALAALQEAGKSVPQDIAVVGYDDIKTSRFIGLSSVDQSMQKIGYAAARKLHDRVQGTASDAPSQVITDPKLEIRASSDFIKTR